MDNSLDEYLNLLNLDYDEAIDLLLKKYGEANDDYFREKSYQKFLDGEIKAITQGKYKRTKEGLYCHHIAENKYIDMTKGPYIKMQNIPFKYQTKEYLVYCNLIEHMILHVIITKETGGQFGKGGYVNFTRPLVNQWMIEEFDPKPAWMKAAKERAFLSKEDAQKLLNYIDNDYLEEFDIIHKRLV